MSTAVAAPGPASIPGLDHNPNSRHYPPLAPSSTPNSADRAQILAPLAKSAGHNSSTASNDRTPPDGKKSPRSTRTALNGKVIVKKEPPSSPSMSGPQPRHRPQRLDLHNAANAPPGLSSRPSAGLAMHDVGLACLSPGFQTQDPTMREQLQRSISVRDQQRSIIESRMLKSAKGDKPVEPQDSFGKVPIPSNKKRPPHGLSIVPPPAERFAHERVIQSAPLGQSFTGRHQPLPPGPAERQPSISIQSTQAQHTPVMQNQHRLPPISDVFGSDTLHSSRPPFHHANSNPSQPHGPPMPSPGFPPQTAHPMSQHSQHDYERPREYRSAEEAVHEITGGRADLQPKIVRYGGQHQPPTPPSPNPNRNDLLTPYKHPIEPHGRRRSRNEYEADSSPPLGTGPNRPSRPGPFGEGRDSPATQQAKKEEFIALCSRAWDLFHS